MKIWLTILMFSAGMTFANLTKSEARLQYRLAATSEKYCEKLLSDLRSCTETSDPLLAGYRACATMMMAKYVLNPYSKLSNFNKGKTLLEKCIATGKENIELRYLRLTVQVNAPAFLGYKGSIQSDKVFLVNSLGGLDDTELKKIIMSFLKSSGLLTEEEKKKIDK